MLSRHNMQSRYWDAYWQQMSREELDAFHFRRIQHLIRFAYERVPFYRQLYDAAGVRPDHIKTWDDFYRLVPVTDKPMIVEDQYARGALYGFEGLPREYHRWFHRTSGTTGRALNEVFSGYDRLIAAYDSWCWGWWDVGLRPGDSIYFAFAYGTFIGFWTATFSAERMGLTVIPGGGLTTEQRVQQILELRPACVCATPTYLLHMARVARDRGWNLADAGVKVLTMAGESGGNVPSMRAALRAGWGEVRICDIYGISELIFLATECREASAGHALGVHVAERHCHSFIVDPVTFAPIFDEGAVGEHIVTTFRPTQPLIKYRTHDLVRLWRRHEHGCGWTWTFLEGGVLGRTDFMVTIKGTNVYPTAVENLLGQVAGLTPYYEIHVERPDDQDTMRVIIEADPALPHEQYQTVAQQATDLLWYNIGVRIEVTVVEPETLPRYELKSRKVIDHRKGE
jgi:phenylacetate-CoA ligase